MTAWKDRKSTVGVLGRRMAYLDTGSREGNPVADPVVLFLHGNPTSSFLWRDVIPAVEPLGRCLAPDLIGMGDSDKLPDPGNPETYGFANHARYLDGFIDAVVAPGTSLWLVVHDWGSALGFDWARRHPDRVAGIAYMEAIVRPLSGWEEWNEQATPIFQALRSDKGESLVLERNLFVERILPGSIIRDLTEQEMAEYRRPFTQVEDRWPTLTWPRNIPIGGDPAEVVDRVQAYADWLARSPVPKLFVDADPGAILIGAQRAFCRGWPNQREVRVAGNHFIQEDSAAEIGRAVAAFITDMGK
ncbi:MAG: haloalkane dehalogenase [Alphaproteobacteria bacterium]|nr:haloalkane dehalogenase [Alphaproteobacteria bacterium]